MVLTLRIPSLRSLALILIGASLGAMLVAPVAASVAPSAVEPAAIQTRVASCAGLSFHASNDRDEYDNAGTLRFHKGPAAGGSGSDGVYRCDAGLPHRAVVTRVSFTLRDASSNSLIGEGIRGCMLARAGLTVVTAGSFNAMANVPGTNDGDPSAAPGDVRLTDTSIQLATVDTARFGYWLECRIVGFDADTGIYGANVFYTISSANG